MKPIITLTLSPAFDLHCQCPDFLAFHENLATVTSFDAGGKGINVSRALTANGVQSLAVVLLGEENAAEFDRRLKEEKIPFYGIPMRGRIRENITLHSEGNAETRISFPGFEVDANALEQVEAAVLAHVGESDSFYLTLTGRVPNGIPMDDVKAFLLRMKKRGAHVTVDSKSFTKEDLLEVLPHLIKPNEEELPLYTDRASDPVLAIMQLRDAGIENVLLTRGKDGALLAAPNGIWRASIPSVTPLSTIGAGDSTIAGFLAAHQGGASIAECLSHAVAFGTAACLESGTKPPRPQSVAEIQALVKVEKIG